MLDLSYIVQDMTNTNTERKTYERKNRFTGESIMLTQKESIISKSVLLVEYDFFSIQPLCIQYLDTR